ncbi:SPOSA6832_04432 [Sporobolomyces salmonicolor]|uniref:SPOSA6832_04432-mRNA-1:cds n=1 Tax=Sporidiobolus salmonicolor TaxID=5005 RepID=A0A0D6ESP3_SPOSA|nr:SPOSA6832_04432 [Sporobolomyces salmonicolor]
MATKAVALGVASFAALASSAHATAAGNWKLKQRSTVTDASSLSDQTFDYVIVGGGTAGLVIANRLSENSSITVAVIEAGTDGSAVEDSILAPAQAYFSGIANIDSPYDWQYDTVNQSELNNREIYWPRGKLLGGSSAVNGLYMIRQSEIEQDSWGSLVDDQATWGWDAVYPYLKKSETWTPPSDYHISEADMTLNASLHGTDGPIHYSYPGLFYNSTYEWMPTLENMGISTRDPAGGENWGCFIATSAINPTNWTRSYSKTGYLDPIDYRTNLVVLSGFQAQKIVFDGTTATGVQFAASANGTTYTVSASQEVILSAGVIGSPQLLQVSGVGASDLLTPLGINVVYELPGVGMHLTDHLSGAITLNTSFPFSGDPMETNTTYAAEQLALWKAGDPNSLYTSPNDAVAYVNLTARNLSAPGLFGEEAAQQLIEEIKANQSALVTAYSTNTNIQAGYNATYSAELRDVYPSAVGQAEILLANTGTYGGYGDAVTVQIQAAIQHPLSRGSVKINSTSTFDKPQIDPGYLTQCVVLLFLAPAERLTQPSPSICNSPADIQILRQAFKFARNVSQTAPFSEYVLNELSPGSAVQTDGGVVSTEYHPAGTCSMLPESEGGVVDNAMRVYGVSGLRVIDSAVVPLGMSAHMFCSPSLYLRTLANNPCKFQTAPLYGIAERAYDLLVSTPKAVGGSIAASNATSSSPTGATGNPGQASSTASSVASTGASNEKSGAERLVGGPVVALATLAIASVLALAA